VRPQELAADATSPPSAAGKEEGGPCEQKDLVHVARLGPASSLFGPFSS